MAVYEPFGTKSKLDSKCVCLSVCFIPHSQIFRSCPDVFCVDPVLKVIEKKNKQIKKRPMLY